VASGWISKKEVIMRYFLRVFLFLTLTFIFFSFAFARWRELPPVPEPVGEGGGIAYGRGYIWCIVGEQSDGFYAYDISERTWIDDLEPLPEEIDYGAIAFEKRCGTRVFVAAGIEGEPDQLFTYTFEEATGYEGSWDDPIYLPEECGGGVSLTFRPYPGRYPTLCGWLYLLVGGGSTHFYSRAVRCLLAPDSGVFPVCDGIISPKYLFFEWGPIDEAVGYHLQVDDNPDFSSPIIDTFTTVSEFKPHGELFTSGTYFYRFRYKKGSRWSKWNNPIKFQVDTISNPSFNFSYPPDSSIVATEFPTIDWPLVLDATKYQLQVDNNPDFTSPEINTFTEVSEYTSKIPLPNGRYYWRVRAINQAGEFTPWSKISLFHVQAGWIRLADIPTPVYTGGALCYHKIGNAESLYAFVGGGSRYFYCYSINNNSWFRDTLSLPQRDGSSLTSAYENENEKYELYAVFGISETIEHHLKYNVRRRSWTPEDRLPEILGPGASITYCPSNDNAYLVIGDGRDNFFVNPNPGGLEEEAFGGSQSELDKWIERKSKISFSNQTNINIQVYDASGKLVRNLFSSKKENEEQKLLWDIKDNLGRKVPSGIYFLMLNKGNSREGLKAIIVK
jgi:hypothetical protein